MFKVAITGNMGSGKTSICRVFELLDVPVFYADKHALKLYSNKDFLKKIAETFGPEILTKDNQLNRQALADIVFKDENKLETLNKLIHPRVFQQFEQWQKRQPHKPYCIQEAAILFETGWHKYFDKTILVYAPEEELTRRVMKRDQVSLQKVKDRLTHQMPQEKKMALADYRLNNDNSQLLIPEVLNLHEEFIHLARQTSTSI